MTTTKKRTHRPSRPIMTMAALIVMLIVQLFPPFLQKLYAVPVQVPGSQVTVEDARIVLETADGVQISPFSETESSKTFQNLPRDAQVGLIYRFRLLDNNWEAEGSDEYFYYEGDYYEINLPDAVTFSHVPEEGISIVSESDESLVIAVLTVADHTARVTFTEAVESMSEIYIRFALNGNFEGDGGEYDNWTPVDFVFGSITYHIGFSPPPAVNIGLSKSGVYKPATDAIEWTLSVTPDRAVRGLSLTDEYSENQEYIDNSFALDGIAVADGLTVDASSRTLTYEFADDTEGLQTITYCTRPTDNAFATESTAASFTNSLKVFLDSTEKGSRSAAVTTDWIQKTGVADSDDPRLLHWTVKINNNPGVTITNPVITDILPKRLKLKDGTLSVTPSGVTGSLSVSPATYDMEQETTLIYAITGAVTGPVTVRYSTTVEGEDDFNSNDGVPFANDATLNWDENLDSGVAIHGSPSAQAVIPAGVNGSILKTAEVSRNFDGSNNRIKWTVTLNRNRYALGDVVLTDDIPAELSYIAGTFKLNGTAVDDTTVYNAATKTLRYAFSGLSTIAVVTYETSVSDYTRLFYNGNLSYPNTAELSDGYLTSPQTSDANQPFSSQVINKSLVSYDYTTRLATWSIVVNRNRMPLTNAVFTDTIPEGLDYVSFAISPTPAGGLLTPPTEGDPVLTYAFGGEINTSHTITLVTRVTEETLLSRQGNPNIVFTNMSSLIAEGFTAVSHSANLTVSNPIVDKRSSYQTGADYIEWVADINMNALTFTDLTITDELPQHLLLDPESVMLYYMTLQPNGSLVKGEKVPAERYSLTVTQEAGGDRFVISLPGVTSSPFRLEFLTDITTAAQINVQNVIKLGAIGATVNSHPEALSVRLNEAGTGGAGVTTGIILHKIDPAGTPLTGARFELYNSLNQKVSEGTTDDDGMVTFNSLLFKSYFVREVEAPDGYLLPDITPRVRLKSTDYATFELVNERAVSGISLQKVDAKGKALAGAEFTLFGADGLPRQTAVSNASGAVNFADVDVGAYTVRETKAPRGYLTSETVIEITVALDIDGASVITTITPDEPIVNVRDPLFGIGGRESPTGVIVPDTEEDKWWGAVLEAFRKAELAATKAAGARPAIPETGAGGGGIRLAAGTAALLLLAVAAVVTILSLRCYKRADRIVTNPLKMSRKNRVKTHKSRRFT